jgi:hypothetical protein
MAICEDCGQEMLVAASCTADVLIIQQERFPRVRLTRPIGPDGRCGDCGVQSGGFHHLGCDIERCPRCHRQLISCGCCWVDEETEGLIAVADGTVVYPAALRGLRVPKSRFPFRDLAGRGSEEWPQDDLRPSPRARLRDPP